MSRFSRIALVLSLVGLTTTTAYAAKKSGDTAPTYVAIEMTGVAQFDEVFAKAKAIHDSLTTQETDLKTARTNVNSALGVATDAPLATALADLKTKAAGKIKVGMNGTMPKLEAGEAVPENVQKGIDSVNGLITVSGKTAETVAGLVPQAEALVVACKDFPAQVPSLVTDPMAALKATKIVANDIKAVGQTPGRLKALGDAAVAIFNDVKAAFAG